MRKIFTILLFFILSFGLSATDKLKTNQHKSTHMKAQALATYPVKGGVSAPFLGVHKNQLIAIGGSNFVDGIKTFYQDVYRLDVSVDASKSEWVKCQPFPAKVAYGAVVTLPDGVLCIGGQDADRVSREVYLAQYDESKKDVKYTAMANLPVDLTNGSACVMGGKIYVFTGFREDGKSPKILSLDLENVFEAWKIYDTNLTTDRQQAVLFSQDGKLLLAGGYDESTASAFADILEFDLKTNKFSVYSEIEKLNNEPQTCIGASIVDVDKGNVLLVGGVNQVIFESALKRILATKKAELAGDAESLAEWRAKAKEYLGQEPSWYKFRTELLSFNVRSKKWESLGNFPQLARAGAGVVLHNDCLYVLGGELKPAVRTEDVNCINLK